MRVSRASRGHDIRRLWGFLPLRKCSERCSALFERLGRHIERRERENERLRQERDEAERERYRDQKRIAELEKEVSRLRRDLEAKATTPVPGALSTPSAMQPAYSKPPARKRRRRPGRKNGHPGARRPAPVHIDRTVEHTLTECPKSA